MFDKIVIGGGVGIKISGSSSVHGAGPLELLFDGDTRALGVIKEGRFTTAYSQSSDTGGAITWGGLNEALVSEAAGMTAAPLAFFSNILTEGLFFYDDGAAQIELSSAVQHGRGAWSHRYKGMTGLVDGAQASIAWTSRDNDGSVWVRSPHAFSYAICNRDTVGF